MTHATLKVVMSVRSNLSKDTIFTFGKNINHVNHGNIKIFGGVNTPLHSVQGVNVCHCFGISF